MEGIARDYYKEEEDLIQQQMTTAWEETDGCAKQYYYATAMYLMSLIFVQYNAVIDKTIGASGYGKNVVDGFSITEFNIKMMLCIKILKLDCQQKFVQKLMLPQVKNLKLSLINNGYMEWSHQISQDVL
eukprot:6496800-Ditylum_brightwellii.AAC.1